MQWQWLVALGLMVLVMAFIWWWFPEKNEDEESPSPEATKKEPAEKKEGKDFFKFRRTVAKLMLPLSILLVVGVAVTLAVYVEPVSFRGMTLFIPWLYWLLLGAGYILLSWKSVKEDQIGVRLFFGKPLDQVEPGPVFAPLGLIEVRVLKGIQIQQEHPADPPSIFRGDPHETPPPGKFQPIRITFGNAIPDEKTAEKVFGDQYHLDGSFNIEDHKPQQVTFNHVAEDDGTKERVTAEAVPVTKYTIKDAVRYVLAVGDEEEANRQLEDLVVSVLQRFLPLMSAGQALKNVEWISLILHHAMRELTKNWGIELAPPKGAYLKQLIFHRDYNVALAAPGIAIQEARAKANAAIGERERLIKEGEGAAQAAKDLARGQLVGRTEGLKEMAKELGVSGQQAMAAEVARTFGEKGTNTIIDSNAGVAGLAAIADTIFKNSSKGGKTP